ncbi:MAG: hypothetical protein HKP12_00700 [Gammaproteobacteria bacterium]|nr:hypothetical protein [Gammaproteobacteria bacterium]
MQKKLPDTIDFFKQVDRNACYECVWPVQSFERLKDVIYDNKGEVKARLKFGTRAGVRCLDGTVEADLELRCERCLDPVKYHIEGGFRFGLISSDEEAGLLPEEFEPLIVTNAELSVIDLVEDELLLSLPIVAKHDEECSEVLQKHSNNGKTQHDTHRPFAALKDLMNS